MGTALKYLTIYTIDIILCTIFFIILTRFFKVGVLSILFYRGCFFIIICGGFSIVILYVIKRFFENIEFDWRDYICVSGIFVGVTLTWFILGPVTVERSISVYMLSYMEQNSELPIDADKMEEVFLNQYIDEFGAFDKRFSEQIESGNIEKVEGGYIITESGKTVVNAFRWLSTVFDTEKWLVYPNDFIDAKK